MTHSYVRYDSIMCVQADFYLLELIEGLKMFLDTNQRIGMFNVYIYMYIHMHVYIYI